MEICLKMELLQTTPSQGRPPSWQEKVEKMVRPRNFLSLNSDSRGLHAIVVQTRGQLTTLHAENAAHLPIGSGLCGSGLSWSQTQDCSASGTCKSLCGSECQCICSIGSRYRYACSSYDMRIATSLLTVSHSCTRHLRRARL